MNLRTAILCLIISLALIPESHLYEYVGCYNQSAQLVSSINGNVTIEDCFNACRNQKTYVGLQGGNNCSCFDKLNAISQRNQCNIVCTGNRSQICGGIGSNYSVYTYCPTGKYGVNCANTCNNCINNERCSYHNGTCPSTCKPGWNGQNCNTDINECALSKPVCNASTSTCNNTIGSYRCQCNSGYTSNDSKLCVDVNECRTGSAACDISTTKCINSDGGFSCYCLPGYERKTEKSCSDIDECALSKPVCNASTSTCNNAIGSYRCQCNSGYTSNDSKLCVDIDECLTGESICDNTTTNCFNTQGNFSCICQAGHEQANDFSCKKIVERSNRDAIIAGTVAGALVLIAALVLLGLICWKRQRHVNQQQTSDSSGSSIESSTNTDLYQTLDQATRDRKSATIYAQLNALTHLPVPPPKTKTIARDRPVGLYDNVVQG